MRTSTASSAALALLVATAPLVWWGEASAATNRAPRITAAVMLDADRDDRADRVRLTYSERINHAADSDGRYPFKVAGYKVMKVLKARKSRTLVIVLRERDAKDIAARPSVEYSRTTRQPVKDLSGKHAAVQTFSATVPLDVDGDGYAATDCVPANPEISPGATDQPDLTFADVNCDGIDGLRIGSIFVSSEGSDGAPGTFSDPLLRLDEALAIDDDRDIYLTTGAGHDWGSTGTVQHSVFGGYDATTWSRSATRSTVVATGAPSVTGDRALQLVELTAPGTNTAGVGSVAMTASSGSLLVEDSSITAGTGGDATGAHPAFSSIAVKLHDADLTMVGGALTASDAGRGRDGANGAAGANGANGGPGGSGSCDGTSPGSGGTSGLSPHPAHRGGAGGQGGSPGTNAGQPGSPSADGTPGGFGGSGGTTGSRGGDGSSGSAGSPGSTGATTQDVFGTFYQPGSGTSGGNGAFGRGGGGGGGGGGQGGFFVDDGPGNGGGGGGGGGAGGTGGTGAGGGGGSFAVYAVDSLVSLEDVVLTTGAGGAGGFGGTGGTVGAGGNGGFGAAICTGEVGAGGNGGRGGNGGQGGNGGHGAGGASIGIVALGASTIAEVTETSTFVIGPGGTSPAGGFAGESQPVKED